MDFYEGLYIDYRAWDKMGLKPLIPFGHGISYTNYSYSNLQIQKSKENCYAPSMFNGQFKSDKQPGGPGSLFQYLVEVTADVKNVGGMQGDEVAQLYVGYPTRLTLRSSSCVDLTRCRVWSLTVEASRPEFKLTKRDFSVWDVVKQKFDVVDGEYKIWVGKSSRMADLTLKGSVTMQNGKVVSTSS